MSNNSDKEKSAGEKAFTGMNCDLSPVDLLVLRDALKEYINNKDRHVMDKKMAQRLLNRLWPGKEQS